MHMISYYKAIKKSFCTGTFVTEPWHENYTKLTKFSNNPVDTHIAHNMLTS